MSLPAAPADPNPDFKPALRGGGSNPMLTRTIPDLQIKTIGTTLLFAVGEKEV